MCEKHLIMTQHDMLSPSGPYEPVKLHSCEEPWMDARVAGRHSPADFESSTPGDHHQLTAVMTTIAPEDADEFTLDDGLGVVVAVHRAGWDGLKGQRTRPCQITRHQTAEASAQCLRCRNTCQTAGAARRSQ